MSSLPDMRLCEPLALFVCMEDTCRGAILPECLITHLRRKHKIPKEAAKLESNRQTLISSGMARSPLQNRYLHEPYTRQAEEPLPQLPLLPVYDIVKCPLCHLFWNGSRAAKAHLRSMHTSAPNLALAVSSIDSAVSIKGQTIFLGPLKRYFPITLTTDASTEKGSVDDVLESAAINCLFNNNGETSAGATHRALQDKTMDLSLKLLGVPSFLQKNKLSCDDAYKITKVDSMHTFHSIVQVLLCYVTHFAEMSPPIPTPIVEFIKIKCDLSQASFTLSLPQKSKKRYAQVVARFITAIVKMGALKLRFFNLPSALVEFAKHVSLLRPSSDYVVLNAVHCFLRMLLLGAVRGSHGENLVLEEVFRFILAGFTKSHERDRARMGGAEDASHSAAALQYFCHVTALGEFLVKPNGFGEIVGHSGHSETERRRLIKCMISTDDCTPAAYLRTVLRKTKRLSASQSPRVNFSQCSKHPYCGRVNNLEVSMNSKGIGSLGFAVRCLQREAMIILQDDLLRNFHFPAGIWSTILSLPDKVTSRDIGYFFGSDGDSKKMMEKWASSFLIHLSTQRNPVVTGNTARDDQGFRATEHATRWIQAVDKLTEILYVLYHICCGGPPRVPEMNSIRLRNTVSGPRNIYLYDGTITVITSYCKTSMQYERGKPIARYLDTATTELSLLHITFIKPVQSFLLRSMFGDDNGAADYMFCHGDGQPLNEGKACKVFRERLAKNGVPLTISLYRHFQTGIVKAFMKEFAVMSADSIAFIQGGHSEATANHRYATVEFDFDTFNAATMAGFQKVSRRWHQLLGITESVMSLREISIDANGEEGRISRTGEATICGTKCVNGNLTGRTVVETEKCTSGQNTEVRTGVGNKRIGFIGREEYDQKHDDESNGNIAGVLYNIPGSPSTGLYKRMRLTEQENSETTLLAPETSKCPTERRFDASQAVKLLLHDSTGHPIFRSDAQKAATYECMVHGIFENYGNCSLIVLPTGGGKTICWAAPAFQEQCRTHKGVSRRKVTLLVIPLISLHGDMLRRCSQYRLNAVSWDDRFNCNASVVICSIDKVSTDEYCDFVHACDAQKLLVRIVVDEVHLVLLWKSFRRFSLIKTRLRPGNVTIPLVLMTATAPPSLTEEIKLCLGATDCCFKITRAKTGRKNISYVVRKVTDPSDEGMFKISAGTIQAELLSLSPLEKIIVFCLTVQDTREVASQLYLLNSKQRVCMYYGSMSPEERKQNFEEWLSCDSSQPRVMIATSAFSCGIDYHSVRTIVHVGGTRTLLEFAQESGRCGRDGKHSICIVLFNRLFFERKVHRSENDKKISSENDEKFGSFTMFAESTVRCRREIMETFIDGVARGPCSTDERRCDICLPRKVMNVNNDNPSSVYPAKSEIRIEYDVQDSGDCKRKLKGSEIAVLNKQQSGPATFGFLSIDEILWQSHQLKTQKCVVCALSKKSEETDHRLCMRSRCFRCMQPRCRHQSKDCRVTPRGEKGKNRCFFCGIPEGKDLHAPGTFNVKGKCHWEMVKNLALLLWRTTKGRKEMTGCTPILRSCGEDYESLGILLCGGERPDEKVWLLSVVGMIYQTVYFGK